MGKHKKNKEKKKLKKLKKLKKAELRIESSEIPEMLSDTESTAKVLHLAIDDTKPAADETAVGEPVAASKPGENSKPVEATTGTAEASKTVETTATSETADAKTVETSSEAGEADTTDGKPDNAAATSSDTATATSKTAEAAATTAASSAASDVAAKAHNLYEDIKSAADGKSMKDVKEESQDMFRRMQLIWRAYFADPQETLGAQFKDSDHRAAWVYYIASVVLIGLIGFLIDGAMTGLRTGLVYMLISFCYPCAVTLFMSTGIRVKLKDVLPVFWVSNIFIYTVHAFAVASMVLGLWFLAIAAEVIALPLTIVFNYMATYTVCNKDSRIAIRTTIFVLYAIVLLFIVFVFFTIAFSVLNTALGQLMDGGFDLSEMFAFLSTYFSK